MGDMTAIAVSPDGSCLPHTMSRFAYGHEGEVSEMRARLVIEAAMNFVQYTAHEMLLKGTYMGNSHDMGNFHMHILEKNI